MRESEVIAYIHAHKGGQAAHGMCVKKLKAYARERIREATPPAASGGHERRAEAMREACRRAVAAELLDHPYRRRSDDIAKVCNAIDALPVPTPPASSGEYTKGDDEIRGGDECPTFGIHTPGHGNKIEVHGDDGAELRDRILAFLNASSGEPSRPAASDKPERCPSCGDSGRPWGWTKRYRDATAGEARCPDPWHAKPAEPKPCCIYHDLGGDSRYECGGDEPNPDAVAGLSVDDFVMAAHRVIQRNDDVSPREAEGFCDALREELRLLATDEPKSDALAAARERFMEKARGYAERGTEVHRLWFMTAFQDLQAAEQAEREGGQA